MRAPRWTGHNDCMRGKSGCWANPYKWVIFHILPVSQHVISWKSFPYFHLQSFETCDRRRVTPGWILNRLHQTFEIIDGHNHKHVSKCNTHTFQQSWIARRKPGLATSARWRSGFWWSPLLPPFMSRITIESDHSQKHQMMMDANHNTCSSIVISPG